MALLEREDERRADRQSHIAAANSAPDHSKISSDPSLPIVSMGFRDPAFHRFLGKSLSLQTEKESAPHWRTFCLKNDKEGGVKKCTKNDKETLNGEG